MMDLVTFYILPYYFRFGTVAQFVRPIQQVRFASSSACFCSRMKYHRMSRDLFQPLQSIWRWLKIKVLRHISLEHLCPVGVPKQECQ